MNKKNTIASISSKMIAKDGAHCHIVGTIEGEYSDLVNVFADITAELLKGGIKQEHVEEAVRLAIESVSSDKAESTAKEEASKEEDDEIPEEVKAGLAFLRMFGIL